MSNSESKASNVSSSNADKQKLDLADRLELGSRVRKLREATGKSALEVAEEVLGYQGSHAAVSRLERGVFSVVNLDHLAKLASFYGSTTEALLKGTGDVETAELPEVTGAWTESDIAPGLPGRLRDLRQALGLTRAQMAVRMGRNASFGADIGYWESGKVAPLPDTILQVATAFGVSGSWMILGAKGKAPKPTQSMRLRALRHIQGSSRPQLAMTVHPMDFRGMNSSIAGAESKGRPLPRDKLVLLAKAFDVPVSFLDPEMHRFNPDEAAQPPHAQGYLRALPPTVRGLVENIVAMFETELLDTRDVAEINKMLSKKAWGRSSNISALEQASPSASRSEVISA